MKVEKEQQPQYRTHCGSCGRAFDGRTEQECPHCHDDALRKEGRLSQTPHTHWDYSALFRELEGRPKIGDTITIRRPER